MKLVNSPVTLSFLKKSREVYGDLGLYWGGVILLTTCFTSVPDSYLLMKFAYSGSGKTISDKVAIEIAEKFGLQSVYNIKRGITPAGMAKWVKNASKNEKQEQEIIKFSEASMIFLEDLSKATRYIQVTSVETLAGLTKDTNMDDLSANVGGGMSGLKFGNPKKVLISGTPSHWSTISTEEMFTEYIDRRSLVVVPMMSVEEFQLREQLANQRVPQTDDSIVKQWIQLFVDSGLQSMEKIDKLQTITDSPARKAVFDTLRPYKHFPEDLFKMIDSLANGHKVLNGRKDIMEEDYQVVEKLFLRFMIPSRMKKKELFLVEEVIRSYGQNGMQASELIKVVQGKSRFEDIPWEHIVERTLKGYAKFSDFLVWKNTAKNTQWGNAHTYIDISDYLKGLFLSWKQEIEEAIK